MFLEAIGKIADEIDFLAFHEPEFEMDPGVYERYTDHYQRVTRKKVNLFLVPKDAGRERAEVTYWVRGGICAFLDPFASPVLGFASLAGPTGISAMRACLTRHPAFVFAHRLAAMGLILSAGPALPPLFFDLDDVEHWALLRRIRSSPTWRLKIMRSVAVAPLFLAERSAIRAASCTFVCSEVDRRYVSRVFSPSVRVVRNSVKIRSSSAQVPDSPSLLFLGYYGYEPNVLAAGDPSPPDLAARPAAGRQCHTDHRWREVGGAEPSLGPGGAAHWFCQRSGCALQRSPCCLLPGANGKRHAGKDCRGCGIRKAGRRDAHRSRRNSEFQEEAEILIRDDAVGFAQACAELLTDEALCSRIGHAARQRALQCYSRSDIVDRIVADLARMLGPGGDEGSLEPVSRRAGLSR